MNPIEVNINYSVKIPVSKAVKSLTDSQLEALIKLEEVEGFGVFSKIIEAEISEVSMNLDNKVVAQDPYESGFERGKRNKLLYFKSLSQMAKVELLSRKSKEVKTS